jgi:hypothetical protein
MLYAAINYQRYRRVRRKNREGADIVLPDLLRVTASCERRGDFSRPCGDRFTNLAACT